jgi:hypothetical protein
MGHHPNYRVDTVHTLNCAETNFVDQLVRVVNRAKSYDGVTMLVVQQEDVSLYDDTIPLLDPHADNSIPTRADRFGTPRNIRTNQLLPEATTSVYTATDTDQTDIPDVLLGSYQLRYPAGFGVVDETYDCVVYATFSANVVAQDGAFLSARGYVDTVLTESDTYTVPVTTGQRVSFQFQMAVPAGSDWFVNFFSGSLGSVATADLSEIRWEINVIRR